MNVSRETFVDKGKDAIKKGLILFIENQSF